MEAPDHFVVGNKCSGFSFVMHFFPVPIWLSNISFPVQWTQTI